jgi:O-antigen/teichoic acid export membrane protein
VYVIDNIISRVMSINPIQRQSLIAMVSLLSVTAIGYLSTIYFAHVLGPAILGSFFLFTTYYGIFALIRDGGFGGAAIKRISEGKDQSQYFTAGAISQIALMSISILILIIIAPYLVEIKDNDLYYWLIIALVIGTVNSISAIEIIGTARVGIIQISNFLNTLSKIIIQVLAVFLGWEVGGLVLGFIFGTIIATIVNFRFIHLSLSKCNISHFKGLFTFSFWAFLSSGGVLIFTYADTLLISMFMTPEDVGIYRIAFQLAAVASFLVLAFQSVLFPWWSKWHAKNDIPMIELSLSKSTTYCLLLAIPVTAGGIILSEKLLYFLYGESFQSGANALIILLFVQIANIFMLLLTMCLTAVNKPRESFMVTLVSAILDIILNIFLIPIFGILGAAIATLLTMTVNALLAYILLKPVVKLSLERKSIGFMIVSSIVMSVVVLVYYYYLGIENFLSLCAIILIGAVIYFIILFTLDKDLTEEIKNLLNSMQLPFISGD